MFLKRKSTIIISTALAVFILDRLTKLAVQSNIGFEDTIPVIRGFFELTYVRNTGAAFGIMAFARDSFRVPFLLASTAAAIGLLVYFVRKTRDDEYLLLVALAMVLGGALGNLADRLVYGYVIDFLYFHVREYYWPAFNVADSGITVGVALLGFDLLIRKRDTGTAGV